MTSQLASTQGRYFGLVAAFSWLVACTALAVDLSTPATLDAAADLTPTAATDAALIAPLLGMLAAPADQRAALAKQLATGNDPRAIAALRYVALHDRHTAATDAAVHLLGRFADAKAVAALVDIATGVEGIRPHRGALDALSQHPLPSAVDSLYRIATDAAADADIRRSAVDILNRDHPALLNERGVPKLGGSAVLSSLGSAFFGGFALSSVGDFADTRSGPYGWLAGAVVGAGTGYMFGRQISTARQHYYLSALSWGSWIGWMSVDALAQRPIDPQSGQPLDDRAAGLSRARAGFSLLGEVAGFALAFAAADALNLQTTDVATANAIAIAATVGTFGGLQLVEPADDVRPGYTALLAASVLGIGAGVTLAPSLKFDSGDIVLCSALTMEGGYFGGFLTDILLDNRPEFGGVALGSGVGALAGIGISQYSTLRPGNVAEMVLLSSYGKALGAGLSFLAGVEDDVAKGVHLAVGASGLLAGALLADVTEYEGGDRAMVPIATALGLWHGGLIGVVIDDQGIVSRGSDALAGLTLVGGAVFGIGSMALAQNTNWSNWQATMGSTGAVWGAWFAGWTLALQDNVTGTEVAVSFLLATDAGIATTAVLMSSWVDIDPRVMAGANFGGLAGASLGALFLAMAGADGDTIIKANLVGSALGLVGGGLAMRSFYAGSDVRTAKTGWSAPRWLRWPFDAVAATPHVGVGGKVDGMVVNGLMAW
ncbi:MAG: hypothetical protein EXR77_19440 [Myxococcales bacterium]|nr:hypothetical protein [Myxococcales bacterium]